MQCYYCEKCRHESPGRVCESCGRTLNENTLRFKWRRMQRPLADGKRVFDAMKVWTITVAVLFLILFLTEIITQSNKRAAMAMVLSAETVRWLVLAWAAGVAVVLLTLGFQGEEECLYSIDKNGANLQTWITPNRIRCWTRLLHYKAGSYFRD